LLNNNTVWNYKLQQIPLNQSVFKKIILPRG